MDSHEWNSPHYILGKDNEVVAFLQNTSFFFSYGGLSFFLLHLPFFLLLSCWYFPFMDWKKLISKVEVIGVVEDRFRAAKVGVELDGLLTDWFLEEPITPSTTCDSLPRGCGAVFEGRGEFGILT